MRGRARASPAREDSYDDNEGRVRALAWMAGTMVWGDALGRVVRSPFGAVAAFLGVGLAYAAKVGDALPPPLAEVLVAAMWAGTAVCLVYTRRANRRAAGWLAAAAVLAALAGVTEAFALSVSELAGLSAPYRQAATALTVTTTVTVAVHVGLRAAGRL